MRIGLVALAAAALALAACGSQSSDKETVTVTPSSAQPTKLSGLQEYPSAQALADDLTKHGHTCNMTPKGGSLYAVDGGISDIDGRETILGIYASQSQMDAQLQMVLGLFQSADMDYGWLAGKNWMINCGSRAPCEAIQADLGGSVTAPLGLPRTTTPTP